MSDFRHNHYVPEWYQKRFVPPGQKDQELFYLDMHPEPFLDPNGISRPRRNPKRTGFRQCFAETDLYTTRIGGIDRTEIERYFFRAIDREGRVAVDWCTNFSYPWRGTNYLNELMRYMSTQKLRTPKGLAWLSQRIGTTNKNRVLTTLIELQQLYSAIWTECVWLIADASQSGTKFIVSDHPATVYNRRCGPRSEWCRGNNDPDIRFHASHTIFPLTLDKILILTNLSWVRNPYQSETGVRPNPNLFRPAIFKITDIQVLRHLTEQEVREINFIIKSRADRYIAAAVDEWLYPERHVTKADWNEYGKGYLLMPDPRGVSYGGEIMIGHRDGRVSAFDEYGRRPWEPAFRGNRPGPDRDWTTFHRFQGEFATLFGPNRRGRAENFMRLDDERDSDDHHQYHLDLYGDSKARRKQKHN